jgi:hypothetical protein
MEAVYLNNNFKSGLSFKKAVKDFFKDNDPDTVRIMIWRIFQCWIKRDCDVITDVSHREMAQFFDQLIDLIGAAYIVHEMDKISDNLDKEQEND